MFYRVANIYSLITFDQDKYEDLLNNIEKSRGYVCYINNSKKSLKVNPRYESYVCYKQAMYTHYRPKIPMQAKPNGNYLFTSILPEGIDETLLEKYYKEYGVSDDYVNEYELVNEGHELHIPNTHYSAIHLPKPIEYLAYENLINMDKRIEHINRTHLSKNFIMHNHRRFTLLPFVVKENDNYSEGYVIANIYDVGIITLQITITFEYKSISEVPDGLPNDLVLPEIQLYQNKLAYESKDFWNREKKKNVSSSMLITHYIDLLGKIGKCELSEDAENRNINWVFSDLEVNKHSNHIDFFNKNKRFYLTYLKNGTKEVVNRYLDDQIDEKLEYDTIVKNNQLMYLCDTHFSVLTFGYSLFHKQAIELLKEEETQLKKRKLYNEVLQTIYKEQTLISMYEYTRFYELSFIKKYFVKKLLNDLLNNKYRTLTEYNAIRKDFNFLKLKYNEDVLFAYGGTAQDLYSSILEKTGTNKLLKTTEDLFKNIREDMANQRELAIKTNENTILIISSILTIVLGYSGLKLIVSDVLSNLPYIGFYIEKHPLRYTLGIWSILVSVMIRLNIKRWSTNKK